MPWSSTPTTAAGRRAAVGWDRRSTLTIGTSNARSVDVCLPRRDQNETGERLAPYANEQWWKRHIERWTGIPWRGRVKVGNCTSIYTGINVRQGDPDHMGKDVLATAGSTRAPDRWLSGEIDFNPTLCPGPKTSRWKPRSRTSWTHPGLLAYCSRESGS